MSGSIGRVAAAAREAGLSVEIRRMGESTRTAEEAARQCGCTVDRIAKSLIFAGERSGRLYLFLVSGSRQLGSASTRSGRQPAHMMPSSRRSPKRWLANAADAQIADIIA